MLRQIVRRLRRAVHAETLRRRARRERLPGDHAGDQPGIRQRPDANNSIESFLHEVRLAF